MISQSTAERLVGPAEHTQLLFINHTAELGGGEIALFNLVCHLDRTRYQPLVMLLADGPLVHRLQAAGINVRVLPISPTIGRHSKDQLGLSTLLRLLDIWRTGRHAWQLRRIIRECGADLVHTNSLKADVIGGLAGRLAGVPVVWHVRDRIADDYLPPIAALTLRWLARWLPRHVVANSRATLNTLDLNAGTVAYSGVVLNGDHADAPPDRKARRPIVGLVGRIARWKGQHVFVRAAAAVHERCPTCRFQIIGAALFSDGPYEQEVRDLVRDLGLEHVVEFTGFRSDVRAAMADLDVLVHASTTPEPFGQVIVEGMAAGKPVVATNGGGVTEIVVDDLTGLLVPMGDAEAMAAAIIRLLSDPTMAAAMGSVGRRRVRELFTIEQTVARVQAVYDEVLGTTG